jgi:hypothetical protein
MSILGKYGDDTWPQYPIEDVKVGDVVRYPLAVCDRGGQRIIARGTVEYVGIDIVVFTNHGWCWIDEVSEDKD